MPKIATLFIGFFILIFGLGVQFNIGQAQERGSTSTPKTIDNILQDVQNKPDMGGVTFTPPTYLPTSVGNPTNIIYRIIDIIFLLAGVVGVIFIIVASIKMIANMGDEEMVKSAVMMIKNTIIGLLIIILSYAAVNFVIRSLFFGGG